MTGPLPPSRRGHRLHAAGVSHVALLPSSMPSTPQLSCEECHRRKQKCDRETPCQNCISRGKESLCRRHEPHNRTNDVLERLAAVEHELDSVKTTLRRLNVDGGRGVGASLTALDRFAEGVDQANTQRVALGEEEEEDGEEERREGVESAMGEQIERRQVGRVLGQVQGSSLVDAQHLPQLEGPRLFQEGQAAEAALQIHGVPKSTLTELLKVLPPRTRCDALVNHFFRDLNWIRQPWPQRSLCQSFVSFWNSGPTLTPRNINTFALLCSLCAIARLSVEHVDFEADSTARKLEARRLHYTARHALMLSSVFMQENLDQIIAWTLACRFLVLERRYGEAYTCAARTVKAAYSIDLHRDGLGQGKGVALTEARRKVWSAVYYFDRTISMFTGRPPVIDDQFCDVCPPSEDDDTSDIYPLPLPNLIPAGERGPTPYAYCVHRSRVALLQGRMISLLLGVSHRWSATHLRDAEVVSIDAELRQIRAGFPPYLQVDLAQDGRGTRCDKSLDTLYGFLPIQRFLLQSETSALCIGLHRPYLLSTEAKDAPNLQACLDAALLDIAFYKDFARDCAAGSALVFQVYIGSHRWFRSVLICGIVLLAHPHREDEGKLLDVLHDFVDTGKRADEGLPPSSTGEVEIVQLFIQGYERRSEPTRKRRLCIDAHLRSPHSSKQARRAQPSVRAESTANQHLLSATHNVDGQDDSPARQEAPFAGTQTPKTRTESDAMNAQQLLDMWYANGESDLPLFSTHQSNPGTSTFSQVFGGLQAHNDGLPVGTSSVGNGGGQTPTAAWPDPDWESDAGNGADVDRLLPAHATTDADFWLSLIEKL